MQCARMLGVVGRGDVTMTLGAETAEPDGADVPQGEGE